MNIFEDLVEELKEENLLEETFVETHQEKEAINAPPETVEPAPKDDDVAAVLGEFKDVLGEEINESAPIAVEPQTEFAFSKESQAEFAFSEEPPAEVKMPAVEVLEAQDADDVPIASAPTNAAEFYTKRATEEVSGLQMVEHVFSGVEREQMKVVPKPYDDLECKKSLHAFMQVSGDLNSSEHAKAEFRLMQETESWYSALSRRDRNISVTHLRRYCETTRPILSSTALISLARFYRNSPFSEQVRSKFDLILTRLLTKEVANEKRKLPFNREELIKHLSKLYSQWASIPLYTANDDESEILIITLKFEEFMTEAENAEAFDDLIKSDFFNRLRALKESTNEIFFAPLVTATAIECNVRVGNRYVDLIQSEKKKFDKRILEDKYGFLHDQAISESSGKTLQLVQLLQEKAAPVEPEMPETAGVEIKKKTVRKASKPTVVKHTKTSQLKVNKWLLTATILIVVVNAGLYVWMNRQTQPETNQQLVERVNLENSALRDYVKEARIANGTFFGVVQPNWATLEDEKKKDVLKKILNAAEKKGFTKAHLLDSNGKTVGYVDNVNLQIY